MRKDNFGICLSFYAVLAFVLAMLDYTTLVALLLGFVIIVHKDQWLSMQVMQALFLCIISSLISIIFGIVSPIYRIPFVGSIFSGLFDVVESLISLAILVFAIAGIAKVAKEQDANIPIAKTFAEKAFGLVRNVTYSQTAPVQNVNPAQNTAPTQDATQTQTTAPIQENENNNSTFTLN